MKTVVGLDPSLTGFAWCIYGLDGRESAETGVAVDTGPAVFLPDRIVRYSGIIAQVLAQIDKLEYPEQIAIEGYSMGSRGRALSGLCEFGGVLRQTLMTRYPCELVEVAPSLVKKFITGKGAGKGTDKTGMAMSTYKRYGLEFDTSDEVDAYGLARIAACLVGAEEPQTAFQREVIEKLKEVTN